MRHNTSLLDTADTRGEREAAPNTQNYTRTMDSKVFVKTKGRIEGVDISKNMMVVGTSNLGGNTWDASLQVFDFSTKEVIAAIQQPSGCADVCWTGLGQRVVSAEDSGDVKVCARANKALVVAVGHTRNVHGRNAWPETTAGPYRYCCHVASFR